MVDTNQVSSARIRQDERPNLQAPLSPKDHTELRADAAREESSPRSTVISPERVRYLSTQAEYAVMNAIPAVERRAGLGIPFISPDDGMEQLQKTRLTDAAKLLARDNIMTSDELDKRTANSKLLEHRTPTELIAALAANAKYHHTSIDEQAIRAVTLVALKVEREGGTFTFPKTAPELNIVLEAAAGLKFFDQSKGLQVLADAARGAGSRLISESNPFDRPDMREVDALDPKFQKLLNEGRQRVGQFEPDPASSLGPFRPVPR